ncbi:DUF2919 domain-containing protein [Psychrosphaera ytuae]|uniref:DUF2919 domain-containing protein n=1 Tax=Psychrosphaera ytuae TaxID=2820710 RepID=A0A975DAW8_9GAMM|nr:DUF2919 family protein [Psychrosphaera ytuae]QTH63815.1 DUF2919 domain-containing protein [Psychrosphaera ytuae]
MLFRDFDLEGRVRVPVGFYLVVLYLCRGYFIWIMSLTHRDDPGLIISLIYPSPSAFYLSMLVGVPGLISYVLFLSKARMVSVVENFLWPICRFLIPISLLIDLSLQGIGLAQAKFLVHWSGPVIFIIGLYLFWYWIGSSRMKRFFSLWLDKSHEQKTTKEKG